MIAIGLDYGTTNSLMAVYQEDMTSTRVIRVMKDSSYDDGKEYVRSPKRLLNDIHDLDEPKMIAYITGCVQALCGKLAKKGVNLSDVVFTITVPNAFKDQQCAFLKEAVVAALKKSTENDMRPDSVHVLPEPVAAALYYAYSLRKSGERNQTKYIIVSDMGGGTTDLAVVRVEMSPESLKFKVVCTEHDSHLGGDDIDLGIMDHFRKNYPLADVPDKVLLPFCRHIKERLSVEEVVSDCLLSNEENGDELEMKMERRQLNDIIVRYNYCRGKRFLDVYKKLLGRLRVSLSGVVDKTGMAFDTFVKDNCILLPVGGSSRVPVLRKALSDTFPNAGIFNMATEAGMPNAGLSKSNDEVPQYDSVSRGAAIHSAYQAKLITGFKGKIVVENRTMHKITINYAGDKLITCVPKSMPDGDDYVKVFRPKFLSGDGSTFTLQRLDFYQGGYEDVMDEDTQLMKSVVVEDKIYANGRKEEDIEVVLRFVISQGRLAKIKVFVENGCKDRSDYHKEVHLLG